ncbi:17 kDa surface antigen [Salinisphaera shabanensis T35B1]|jgi:outer membrane lipoprotein SlyB|uniref:17 kDa surface antigen protein n=1 Tax=Salinisphaera shabanensis E1L3A TaxID=1033802 RepID=U2EMD7_9GAMM|nr:glycine zipper domain-containing protein [Salinisphaera shabanensis]ERJ19347.1 17 kDa surface antigen protein [Salinisphaera shabanensis E1L3A]|tara:strand:- start:16 stop:321 length:306 start_codon:yes stop_codon:yes gene_type:complete
MRTQAIQRWTVASLLALSLSAPAFALDDDTLDAAVGGGLGGAAGAAIGNEVGGRTGAILGGAAGAAGGAAITTDNDRRGYDHRHEYRGQHCPPGQAKKGRC